MGYRRHRRNESPTPSVHRLQPGLPGYLIPFAPLAFDPQCQLQASKPPSPRVFFPISTHLPLHRKFHLPILHSSHTVSNAIVLLSRTISHPTYMTTYDPFTPSKSGQRSLPLYYRGCWHRVSRSFFLWYHQIPALFTQIHLFPNEKSLQSEDLHPLRGVAPSGFRPLWKIPYCCLP